MTGRDYARPSVRLPEPRQPWPMTRAEQRDAYERLANALEPARREVSQLIATQSARPAGPEGDAFLAFAEIARTVLSAVAIEARRAAARTLDAETTLTAADAA
ncbi:MAG TPA: hypothetical protein VF192_12200 [Longimicrobiales bacterium]